MLKVYLFIATCFVQPLLAQDSLLMEYLSIALNNNPLIAQKRKAHEKAQVAVDQNSAWLDPTLNVGYGLLPIETRSGPNYWQLSVKQPLEWFGLATTRKKQAQQLAAAQYQSYQAVKNQVFLHTYQAYYMLYSIQQQIKAQQQAKALLNTWLTVAQTRYEQGNLLLSDLLQLQMNYTSIAVAIEVLQDEQVSYQVQLNKQLGRLQLGDLSTDPLAVADTLALATTLPVLAYAQSPLIRKISAQRLAAQSQQRIAYQQGLPQFQLGIAYAIIGKNESTLPNNGRDVLTPNLGIHLPIYRKKHQAHQQAALLEEHALAAQQQATEQALFASHAQATQRVKQAKKEIQLHTEQIAYANQIIDLRYQAYLTQQADFDQVLHMQQISLAHALKKAKSIGAFFMAWAELKFLSNTHPFD